MLSTNEEFQYLHKKNICLYPIKLCWEKGQSFEEKVYEELSLLLKNFNIIQFGFSMMWRIIRISEAVITFTVICIILHNILSLIQ